MSVEEAFAWLFTGAYTVVLVFGVLYLREVRQEVRERERAAELRDVSLRARENEVRAWRADLAYAQRTGGWR